MANSVKYNLNAIDATLGEVERQLDSAMGDLKKLFDAIGEQGVKAHITVIQRKIEFSKELIGEYK